ncbi:MAG: cupredoxin domain-containing protein [Candidatus Aenigmarchaeota archaeon]|nr:cupredoxin domain-containing protein [Candidatus Aenigmarchaeota archaeon]
MDIKFLLPIFLAASILVSGCTSSPTTTTTTAPTTTIPATTTTTATGATTTTSSTTTTQASVKEFSITASQWKFEPNTITVKQGDTVKLTLTSIDVTHGVSIPTFGVNKQIDPGKTATVQFVADKKGTFTFACSVFCGAGHSGMTGKLIVE